MILQYAVSSMQHALALAHDVALAVSHNPPMHPRLWSTQSSQHLATTLKRSNHSVVRSRDTALVPVLLSSLLFCSPVTLWSRHTVAPSL